jgi:hypothetical protein
VSLAFLQVVRGCRVWRGIYGVFFRFLFGNLTLDGRALVRLASGAADSDQTTIGTRATRWAGWFPQTAFIRGGGGILGNKYNEPNSP